MITSAELFTMAIASGFLGAVAFVILRDLISWREVRNTRVHSYQVHRRTGKRRVIRIAGGHQPIDQHWLDTGIWERPKGVYPKPQK